MIFEIIDTPEQPTPRQMPKILRKKGRLNKVQPVAAIGCEGGISVPVVASSNYGQFSVTRTTDRQHTDLTLYSLLDLFMAERRPSTSYVVMLEAAIKLFVEVTGVWYIHLIEREHFLQVKTEILDVRKNAANTYNIWVRHFRALLNAAKPWGFDLKPIMDGIKTIVIYDNAPKAITDSSIKTVMEWLDSPGNLAVFPAWFWKILIRTLYYTGMRRRQVVGLTWGDIHLKSGIIHLQAAHSKTKRGWDIPLPDQLLAGFAELQRKTEEALRRSIYLDDQVFNVTLFNNRYRTDGNIAKTMTVDHVSGGFKRIGKLAGVEISPHRFRHAFATKLANGDGGIEGIKEVQRLLGHTNLSTTMGYIQVNMGKMRNMMGGLGNDI